MFQNKSQRFVEEKCHECLKILEYAYEQDCKQYAKPKNDTKKYIEVFQANNSIPLFLYELYKEKDLSKRRMEHILSKKFHDKDAILVILNELETNIKHEEECSYMDKNRCKGLNEEEKTLIQKRRKESKIKKPKTYKRKKTDEDEEVVQGTDEEPKLEDTSGTAKKKHSNIKYKSSKNKKEFQKHKLTKDSFKKNGTRNGEQDYNDKFDVSSLDASDLFRNNLVCHPNQLNFPLGMES